MECASRIVELFGIREFFEDVDRGREFWRDESAGGIVSIALDWAAGEGFAECFGRYDVKFYETAQEYRKRYETREIALLAHPKMR